MDDTIRYWSWFFKIACKRLIVSTWFLLHLFVGLVLSLAIKVDMQTAASTVLLPLAGILVGLTFAWAGNAQGLMQTKEISELARRHPNGLAEYIYTYQTSILMMLITTSMWALIGMKVFEHIRSYIPYYYFGLLLKTLVFAMTSLTLRECWRVVCGASWMLQIRDKIQEKHSEHS